MKKNTKTAPKTATKPLNVFKLKAGELKMIHGGKGVVITFNGNGSSGSGYA